MESTHPLVIAVDSSTTATKAIVVAPPDMSSVKDAANWA